MDLKTVFISSHILYSILTVFIFVVWIYYRRLFNGLTYYLLGLSSFSLGSLLIIFRGSLHILGIIISNILIILGMVLSTQAFFRLILKYDSKKTLLLYLLPVIILIEQIIFGYYWPDLMIRIIFMSAVPFLLMTLNIIVIIKAGILKTLPGIFIFTTCFILGTTMLTRIIITPLTLGTDSFLQSGSFQAMIMFIWMITIVTTSISIIILIFNELHKIEETHVLEKEHLINEIDHRIKNNLNSIHGILKLHRSSAKDEKVKDMIMEIDSQIMTITRIHNLLYKKNEIRTISLKEYLSEIINGVLANYNLLNIDLQTDIPETRINFTDAMNFGLIVNELITNSCKYAFKNTESGQIHVNFLEDSENSAYILTVRDNGIGLPSDFKLEQQNSMGMKLVRNIAEYQAGKIEIKTGKESTEFKITIPIDK